MKCILAFFLVLGYHTYTHNETSHTARTADEVLTVRYEDGKWSKPYYDCGGGNIWMLTYTVPFFGYRNGSYFFKWVFRWMEKKEKFLFYSFFYFFFSLYFFIFRLFLVSFEFFLISFFLRPKKTFFLFIYKIITFKMKKVTRTKLLETLVIEFLNIVLVELIYKKVKNTGHFYIAEWLWHP